MENNMFGDSMSGGSISGEANFGNSNQYNTQHFPAQDTRSSSFSSERQNTQVFSNHNSDHSTSTSDVDMEDVSKKPIDEEPTGRHTIKESLANLQKFTIASASEKNIEQLDTEWKQDCNNVIDLLLKYREVYQIAEERKAQLLSNNSVAN